MGSSKQEDVTTTTSPWKPIQPYITELAGTATGLMGQPVNPYTTQGQSGLLSYATSPGLQQQIANMQSTSQFLTDPRLLSPGTNPYLEQTAQAAARPITQALTESILPSIRSGATSAGQYGSTRQGIAEGLAIREAERAIADQSAGIYSNAYQSGLNQLLQGLALSPSVAQFGTYPSGLISQVGAEQEALPWQRLLQAASVINPQVAGTGGSQTQPYFANQSADIGSILGLAGSLMSMFGGASSLFGGASATSGVLSGAGAAGAAIACSRGYKENNQPIDTKKLLTAMQTLDVERWNYKGDDKEHIGPYAEQFKELFGVGDGKSIPIVDIVGVLIVAVKELSHQIEELRHGV